MSQSWGVAEFSDVPSALTLLSGPGPPCEVFNSFANPVGMQYASVLIQRLSSTTETVLFIKITRNRIVLSFKDSPRKSLGRRPHVSQTDACVFFKDCEQFG